MNSSEIGSETNSSIEPNDQDWTNAVDKHVEKYVKNYFKDKYESSDVNIEINYDWEDSNRKTSTCRIAYVKMNGENIGNFHYTSDFCISSTSKEIYVKDIMTIEGDINKFLTKMKL